MRFSASFRPCATRLEKRKDKKATTSSTSRDRAIPGPASQDGSPARLCSCPGVAREPHEHGHREERVHVHHAVQRRHVHARSVRRQRRRELPLVTVVVVAAAAIAVAVLIRSETETTKY
jgi:hypothetical protein